MSATGDDGATTQARAQAHAPVRPELGESLRQVGQAGRAGLGAAGDAAKAMRSLVAADISLARSALGRMLALTGVAIVFGGSAWLLLMAVLVVMLNAQAGLAWSLSLLIPALLNGAVAWFAGWRAMRYFEYTRLQATRRQLARLGIGELADFVREATGHRPVDDGAGRPLEDERGADVTPP